MASVIPYAMREMLNRIHECSSSDDPDVRTEFWLQQREYFETVMNDANVPKDWMYDKNNLVRVHTLLALDQMGFDCYLNESKTQGLIDVVIDRNGMQMMVQNIP